MGFFPPYFKVSLSFLYCDLSGESVIYYIFLNFNLRQNTKGLTQLMTFKL